MHWLLFIHKILFSSTCFEPQVLIFRRIQLYTCSIWYRHSLWDFLVACRYTAWVRTALTQSVYRQSTRNSHREWQYHMLHVYNCILLKMSTWGSKDVEENSILWINNNQCINTLYICLTNIFCVYTVLRYSWWWTVDRSETCGVLDQINLRNSASRWLSVQEWLTEYFIFLYIHIRTNFREQSFHLKRFISLYWWKKVCKHSH